MPRKQKQFKPVELFKETSFLGLELAKEFVKTRLKVENDVVKSRERNKAEPFGKNAGAIEVTSGEKTFRSHGFSKPELKTSGVRHHTERVLMSGALEELMPENFQEGGIRRPSQMVREPSANIRNPKKRKSLRERSALESVTNNASKFKSFLEGTDSVVKMFSERVPCGGTSGCNKFLDNILPENDENAVGFFTGKISEFDGAPQLIEELTLGVKPGKKSVQGVLPAASLQSVYQRYLDSNSTIEAPFSTTPKRQFGTSIDDDIVKVFDVRNSARGRGSFNELQTAPVPDIRLSPSSPSSHYYSEGFSLSPSFSSPFSDDIISSPEEFIVETAPGVFTTRTIDSPFRFNDRELNDLSNLAITPTFDHRQGRFEGLSPIPFSVESEDYTVPPVNPNREDNHHPDRSAEHIIDQTHHRLHNHGAHHHGHDHQSSADS